MKPKHKNLIQVRVDEANDPIVLLAHTCIETEDSKLVEPAKGLLLNLSLIKKELKI